MKDFLTGNPQPYMWGLAFVTVSLLVGLGKLDPEVLKMLLFSLGGAVAASKPISIIKGTDAPSGS